MNWSIFKRDFKSSKAIHTALILFIVFSACLSVLSVITAVQTITSISELYEVAQPPHFLQMHKGELNQDEIDQFMKRAEGIESWQTVHMIDVYGENISVTNKNQTFDMSDCLLDIGFVKQNPEKDLLLDPSHQKVALNLGEVGIPILLKEMYDIQIGDQILLTNQDQTYKFIVKTFILDAQMNSPMVSSTRILLSDADFDGLVGVVGEPEYIIEAYFTDKEDATQFQTLYENAGLPKNGQAVTYTIIFILSALTDLVMVFVMVLVSGLLILVSFICVKYTMMAALEENIGEIGTMKAIGFNFKDIRSYYLIQYRIIAILGVCLGSLLAIVLSQFLMGHIQATFGEIKISATTIGLSLIAALCVYGLIMLYCRRVLKKIRKLSVYDALVSGKGFEKNSKAAKDGLYKSKKMDINWVMSLREVFYKFKNWLIIFMIVWLIGFMVIVPINLMNTFNSPDFITYMGSSLEDIFIEIENGESLLANREIVVEFLKTEKSIETYYELKSVSIQSIDKDNLPYNLHVDCGKSAGEGLQYLDGQAPIGINEIAISYLNAQELNKETGDLIQLSANDETYDFLISGVYQDVTSGGFTAKSKFEFEGVPAEKFTFSVDIKDSEDSKITANAWSESLNQGISVEPMDAFINQTLGGVVKQLKGIVLIISLLGIGIAGLITVLFLKLRLAKDVSQIAILKAIGFSVKDIQVQYLVKIGVVTLAGIIMGIVSTHFLGNAVINAALSLTGLGINKVNLVPNIWIEFLICPAALMTIILTVTAVTLKAVKRYHLMSLIKE